MPSQKQLKTYARLIVECGVCLLPGQTLVMTVPAEHYAFARILQEEAYRCGAGKVETEFTDELVRRNDYLYASEEKLSKVRESEILKRMETQGEKAAFLHIVSDYPGVFKGVDEAKAGRIRIARGKAFRKVQEYTMKSFGQWCVAAIPNSAWAKQVFPEIKDEAEAVEQLYQAIFHTVYMDRKGDAVRNWTKHGDGIRKHCDIMNAHQFAALHFKNDLGTDLLVPLPKNHIWGGGREKASLTGQWFDANIPTEEIFTTPHRMKTEGTVAASRPLCLDGRIIDGFSFRFHKGKVVEWKAKKGAKSLESLLATDSGSVRLGEVALVPYDSSISNLNILFYDTLFDENAACHLALGASYPTCIDGGDRMSDKELRAAGGNVSAVHEDFMFGTADLAVTGIAPDGTETPVFRNGNFVF